MWNAARFINNYPHESEEFVAKNEADKWIEKNLKQSQNKLIRILLNTDWFCYE